LRPSMLIFPKVKTGKGRRLSLLNGPGTRKGCRGGGSLDCPQRAIQVRVKLTKGTEKGGGG